MPFAFFSAFWNPPGIDLVTPDEVHRYMTRVIYFRAFVSILAFTLLIGCFVLAGFLPLEPLAIVFSLVVVVGTGLYLSSLRKYRISTYILIGVFFALGITGSVSGGLVGTSMLFYLNAVLLSSHLLGQSAMWSMVIVSLVCHFAIGTTLVRPDIESFLSAIIPTTGAMLGIAFLENYGAKVHDRSVVFLKQNMHALEDEIVERYKAEEALRESERRYRDVVEQATDVIFTIAVDGHYTFVNAAALRVAGYSKDEMLRLLYTDLVLPEYVPIVKIHFHRQYIDRTAFSYAEFPFRNRQGDVVWLGYNVSLVMEGERVHGFHVIGRDVTERKQFEDALRRSEEHYRSLFELAYDPIIIYDPDTRIVLAVNQRACDVYGYAEHEFIGGSLDRLESHLSDGGENFRRLPADAAPHHSETVHVRKDSVQIHMLVTESWIEYQNRKAILSLNRDITERKQGEEALRHAQKMESLGIMAGGVAHDFNNLLQAILGQSALALGRMDETSAAFGNVQKAEKAAMRASELTHQLLAYSGRGRFQLRRVSINELLRENLHLLEVTIPKSARLKVDFASSIWDVEADSGQMQQLVMNLIINAGEALGERAGTICVRTSMLRVEGEGDRWRSRTGELLPLGLYVLVEVEDDGIGMTDETLEKIFDPFFTTKFTGRGLGLAAVLGIIRGHRGGLIVRSQLGKGTMFSIALPAVKPELSRTSNEERSEIHPIPGVVLVIDDEALVREVVADILQAGGVNALMAHDGESGIAMYREHQKDIQVVLLDLSMPGMSGEEVFRNLKSFNPEVRVIISSGYSETEALSRLGAEGVAGFIQKPYRGSSLLSALAGIVRRDESSTR